MKRRYGAVSLALVLSVLLAVMAVRDTEAIPFNPTLTATLSTQEAGAPVDITSDFLVPKGTAFYFGQVSWTPPEFTLSQDVPLGAVVGKLDSVATLGLANQVCNTAFAVKFDSTYPGTPPGSGLLNSSVNIADTVTYAGQFDDTDGNGLPDGVDKYPDFLTRIFPGVQPLSRSFGQASVAGKPVSLNFVVFSPGVTLPGLGTLPAEYGYPSISVLQDNGDPGRAPAPNAISDNCTPLTSTTVNYGVSVDNPDTAADEGGYTIQSNPAVAGTYTFHSRTISLWDADDDGWDNSIDTCPYDVNVGDPTVAGSGDQDGDGLDDACDPTPTEATNGSDHDNDGYVNRLDNCPLVPNGLEATNQADADVDNIGDDCDLQPDFGEGPAPADVIGTTDVTITGAAATQVATATPAATVVATATTAATTAATATGTAAATKTATAAATKTATAAATKTATAAATKTPTPAPTATTGPAGNGSLSENDEGFPTWAWIVIGVAVVVALGGLGTAFTVLRRR